MSDGAGRVWRSSLYFHGIIYRLGVSLSSDRRGGYLFQSCDEGAVEGRAGLAGRRERHGDGGRRCDHHHQDMRRRDGDPGPLQRQAGARAGAERQDPEP